MYILLGSREKLDGYFKKKKKLTKKSKETKNDMERRSSQRHKEYIVRQLFRQLNKASRHI